jgi:hypothetical protein
MLDLQSQETSLCKALNLTAHASGSSTRLNILELGTGCGIVGMTLASVLPNCNVKLSDLPEAREIVEKNITGPVLGPLPGSSLSFLELDWDNELPAPFSHAGAKVDLVLAADCTYNSDSRYAIAVFELEMIDLADSVQPCTCAYTTATGKFSPQNCSWDSDEDAT